MRTVSLRVVWLAVLWGVSLTLQAGTLEKTGQAVAVEEPREILSLFYGPDDSDVKHSVVHLHAEAVLNHLGLTVRHVDLAEGLPSDAAIARSRGVIAWLTGDRIPDPEGFVGVFEKAHQLGKKVVFSGVWPFEDMNGEELPIDRVQDFFRLFGLFTEGVWIKYTYNYQVANFSREYVGFESGVSSPIPSFYEVTPVGDGVRSLLTLENSRSGRHSSLVALSDSGGYIAAGFGLKNGGVEGDKQWIIDPYNFFSQAFDTGTLPKADTTTLLGRRIFYSHIDGDGWNSVSEVRSEGNRRMIAAEVIYERIVKGFPDLPVTIAPVAADLDTQWRGTEKSIRIARKFFAEDHVELGTHTYTHPFYWGYYENYDPAEEQAYRGRVAAAAHKASSFLRGIFAEQAAAMDASGDELKGNYEVPRAYLDQPFSLKHEISGSVAFIEALAPPGKKVQLIQWTGDTTPYEAAVLEAKRVGLANINGGDSRFDPEYPSLAWVAPVGIRVGDGLQIYSSNSNENTYTELWTNRFFGFRHLTKTLRNTEHPKRIKPLNVYYHIYSGEKVASLNALVSNLEYASSQRIIPIDTSLYARIGEGFFATKFERLGTRSWRVLERGALQTIRFDDAPFLAVDFAASEGIIGQSHFQGSLYVYLEPQVSEPIVTLKELEHSAELPEEQRGYLVESRWRIWGVRSSADRFEAQVQGFGPMETTLKVAANEHWAGRLYDAEGSVLATVDGVADRYGQLRLTSEARAVRGGMLDIRRQRLKQ